ncbi:MAG TPA: twin-arginine translocase TatA/TatE family subunit [Syntrophomonadaceae bacterium]|nr:twin-arginine translocase TatA/TatE family subunit [Syntrophomonadaceae bacterium]
MLYKAGAFCHNIYISAVLALSGMMPLKEGRLLFGLIGNFGPWELVLILVIVLIIVGPGKLPQVGESLGKAIQSFRKAKEQEFDELEEKQEK